MQLQITIASAKSDAFKRFSTVLELATRFGSRVQRNAEHAVGDRVAWAVTHTTGPNRDWYLKVAVGIELRNLLQLATVASDSDLSQAVEQAVKKHCVGKWKWLKDFTTDATTVEQALQHWFSYKTTFDKFRTYVLTNKTWDTVVTELTQLENELVGAHTDATMVGSSGKLILKFPDGSGWFDLEKPHDAELGNVAQHCGNTAYYARNATEFGGPDTCLVYQEPLGNGNWDVPLFFVLHHGGLLGESKGKQNNKPLPKYHSKIVALLKLPIIKGIVGGGWMPEHNFKLADLDPGERESLVHAKPQLVGIDELVAVVAAGDPYDGGWEFDQFEQILRNHELLNGSDECRITDEYESTGDLFKELGFDDFANLVRFANEKPTDWGLLSLEDFRPKYLEWANSHSVWLAMFSHINNTPQLLTKYNSVVSKFPRQLELFDDRNLSLKTLSDASPALAKLASQSLYHVVRRKFVESVEAQVGEILGDCPGMSGTSITSEIWSVCRILTHTSVSAQEWLRSGDGLLEYLGHKSQYQYESTVEEFVSSEVYRANDNVEDLSNFFNYVDPQLVAKAGAVLFCSTLAK